MDLNKMLKRIGMENVKRTRTLGTLKNLCMAFVSNIPYETLDMFGGKRKVWHLPTIYNDIVVKKRGGFCCDMNGLLQWILKEFGFHVELLKAFTYVSGEKFFDVSSHIAMIVTFENGEKWLADVGWGGASFVYPLQMDVGLEQPQPNGIYRLGKIGNRITVEKKKQIYLKTEEDIVEFNSKEEEEIVTFRDGKFTENWNILYGFYLTPCELEDFQEGHDFAHDKHPLLQNNSIVVLQNERGRKFLVNNLFCEKEYVNPETIKLVRFKNCTTVDEIYLILEEEFGIKLDFKLNLKVLK